jgi:hypothetical protein
VGITFVITAFLVAWCIIIWRRRQARAARYGGTSNKNLWQPNPAANDVPFQVAPTPNPYSDEAQFSVNQSRTALAEQVLHNRRTPRPDENNPYSDNYLGGGSGR